MQKGSQTNLIPRLEKTGLVKPHYSKYFWATWNLCLESDMLIGVYESGISLSITWTRWIWGQIPWRSCSKRFQVSEREFYGFL